VARLRGARLIVHYHFFRLREAAADGEDSGGSEASPWERAIQLHVLYQTLLYLGRLDDAARIREELEPLATKIGQSYTIARCRIARAWVECGKAPDLDQLETVLQQALQSDPQGPFFWDVFSEVQLSMVDFLRGNWTSALFHAHAACRLEGENSFQGIGAGTLFRQLAYAGDRGGALALLHEKRAWLPRSGRPNTIGSWWMFALMIEGLVILGEHARARELYPLARELVETGAVALWPIFRFSQTVAGIAAAAAGQWEAAEEHFQTALHQAEAVPHRLEQAEIRRFHALMLMDRATPGDRERAGGLLRQARETYEQIDMRAHGEITQTLID
jgi:tetratricopeptide (TPR) repeat protein